MKMQAATAEHLRENPNAREDAIKIIRENATNGKKTELVFVRDLMMVSDITSGAIVPLNIQDILNRLPRDSSWTRLVFPCLQVWLEIMFGPCTMVEAQLAGEGVALSDTKIPFSKMQAAPERVGIAIPVTNQTLNQSAGILKPSYARLCRFLIRLLLNKILFSTEKLTALLTGRPVCWTGR